MAPPASASEVKRSRPRPGLSRRRERDRMPSQTASGGRHMNAPDTTRPLDPAIEADLLAAVESNQAELTALLATLVRFPSLLGQEASAQDFMEGLFRGMGLKTTRFSVSDAELSHLPGYSPA